MEINEKILYSQLKALVELNQQTSIKGLVEVFVFNLKVIFPSKTILLISSHGPKAMNRLAFTDKNLMGVVDKLLQRIGNTQISSLPVNTLEPRTIIRQEEKSSWVQIPINTRIGVIGFLQIAGAHHEKNIFQAEMHIKTFTNQIILLSLNERDALTRLYNRESFNEKLSALLRPSSFQRKSDHYRQYVLAFVQADDIELQTDPVILDSLLLTTSRLISDTIREYDWAFRYDTHRFAIVLHECDLETARLALNRLNEKFTSFDFPMLGKVSFSMGYMELDKGLSVDECVAQTELALRHAQEDGGGLQLSNLDAASRD